MTQDAAARLLAELRPGAVVYIPGSAGEPTTLRDILSIDPARTQGVRFVSCLAPGINDFDYAGLHPGARLTTFMASPALQPSFEAGRVHLLPLAYTGIAAYIENAARIDTALFQVTPPDADGLCSAGVAADFVPQAWRGAKRRIALVNPSAPRPPRAPKLALADFDLVVEIDAPVLQAQPASVSAQTGAIADRVAALIPDGASVQTGIGGVPGAVLDRLTDHRGLVIHSGIVGEGLQTLAQAGALAAGGAHVAGVALGAPSFYQFLVESDLVTFADTARTHGAAALARLERFVSVNSALEIDLFGQANLEWRGGRAVSGLGGAPDFIRAAGRAADGLSIVALASTAGGGGISRITSQLTSPTVSIGRDDIDVVVTEHGVARIRNLSLDERAEALIAIADPRHQDTLVRQWAAMRAGF